jgi:hypothetical protein
MSSATKQSKKIMAGIEYRAVIARERSDRSNPTQSPRAKRGGPMEIDEITTASFRSLVTTLWVGLLRSQGSLAMTIFNYGTASRGRRKGRSLNDK